MTPTDNQTLQTLHSLRSIHGDFSGQEIPEAHLEAILDAAVRAANSSARQVYSIVTVSDRGKMKQLCGYAGSRLLVFCADFNRLSDQARYLGYQFQQGRVIPFLTSCVDTILAAQNACVAARSLGIDSLFTNGIHRGNPRRVFELLKLPERYCFPVIALVLGYATAEPSHQRGRWRGPGIVHPEEYHRLTADELAALVAAYDDPEQHLGLHPTWKQEGFEHYLSWFYDKWQELPKAGQENTGSSKSLPLSGQAEAIWELLQQGGWF